MKPAAGSPFDSIESAHEFLALLAESAMEAKQAVTLDVQASSTASSSRRLDALKVSLYNLEKLETHLTRSVRILNDLRSLRRLLYAERAKPTAIAAKPLRPEPAKRPALVATPAAALPQAPARPAPLAAA